MVEIKLSLQDLGERTETLSPDEQGYYHVPLEWRYVITNPPLDNILQEAGLEYVKRPPGTFHELWILRANAAYVYNSNGDLRIHSISFTTPPTGYVGPTF